MDLANYSIMSLIELKYEKSYIEWS
jgi:hypothetical protein